MVWEEFLGKNFFVEDFRGRIFGEEFFCGRFLGKNFWGRIFGEEFWGKNLLGQVFGEEFWRTNYWGITFREKCFPKHFSQQFLPPKFFPKNSSPTILPQKFFPKSFSPKNLPQNSLPQKFFPNHFSIQKKISNGCKKFSQKNGQHFALFYFKKLTIPPKKKPALDFANFVQVRGKCCPGFWGNVWGSPTMTICVQKQREMLPIFLEDFFLNTFTSSSKHGGNAAHFSGRNFGDSSNTFTSSKKTGGNAAHFSGGSFGTLRPH